MTYIALILLFLFLVSGAYNWRLWKELKTWAEWARYGRIALSYKGKVQLQAPLTEFVAWAHALKADEHSKGRVIWKQGPAACVIAKAAVPKTESRFKFPAVFSRKGSGATSPVTKTATKPGKYTSQDDTDQASRRAARKPGQNTADTNRKPMPVPETTRVANG